MKSGIYVIKNNNNNKVYVGQSTDANRRIAYHKCKLKSFSGDNKYLNRSCKKHGIENFEFEVLEFVDISRLDEREKYWIDKYNSTSRNNGYNIEGGGSVNKTITEEIRNAKIGEKNPMHGKKHNGATLVKMVESSRGMNSKLSLEQVAEMKECLANGSPQKDMANKYGVKVATVSKIQGCINWGYVRSDLNEKLVNMHEKKMIEIRDNIRRLHESGFNTREIVERCGSDYRTVTGVTGESFTSETEKLRESVKKAFSSGTNRAEIISKFGISENQYKSYTKDIREKVSKEMQKKAVSLRAAGVSVSEIASLLGKHRTTITEWTTHHANTEVTAGSKEPATP